MRICAGAGPRTGTEIDSQDIKALVRLLRSGVSAAGQMAAARALGQLAVNNPVNQQAIMAEDALPRLRPLLHSGSQEVRQAAETALRQLADHDPPPTRQPSQ
jgi:HEAT repeat protein